MARDRSSRSICRRSIRGCRGWCAREFTGSILDTRHARTHPRRVRDRSGVPSRGAALDAIGVHAGDGAFQVNVEGTLQAARVRAAGRGVARTSRHLRLSLVDRRLRPAGRGDAREGGRGASKTTGTSRRRCTGATSCIASSWARITRVTTSSWRSDAVSRVDFRACAFPGLISAFTVPSGGTSDYAPEMIHAAAQGEAYQCFVRPDTRIPFMAMPDGVEALLKLAAAPRERLTRTAYNVRAFNPSAEEIRDVVLARVSRTRTSPIRSTRSARASSIPGRRTSTTAPRAATGDSRPNTTSSAPSANTSSRTSASATPPRTPDAADA